MVKEDPKNLHVNIANELHERYRDDVYEFMKWYASFSGKLDEADNLDDDSCESIRDEVEDEVWNMIGGLVETGTGKTLISLIRTYTTYQKHCN